MLGVGWCGLSVAVAVVRDGWGGNVGVGLFCGGCSGVLWMRCLGDEGYLTDLTLVSDRPITFDSRSRVNALIHVLLRSDYGVFSSVDRG